METSALSRFMPLGPLMTDVAGLELTAEEGQRLCHPLLGAVILFSRNYCSPEQLHALAHSIRGLRSPSLLVAVDHEGGRVQRFREGFTAIPAMGRLGKAWERDRRYAVRLAGQAGFVLAAELRACGVDFSFAPVLDLDYGRSGVIGDRAFHRDPEVVAELALSLMRGMAQAGMAAVGKHFPGHGYAEADSHTDLPVDGRDWETIAAWDLAPFRKLAGQGLAGVMPAHVVYPQVDALPAGFSRKWLQEVLRGQLAFGGAVFSDDLSMVGAHSIGDIRVRADAALDAGCDMVLVCNDTAAAEALLANLERSLTPVNLARLARFHGHPHPKSLDKLRRDSGYRSAVEALTANLDF